MTKNLSIFTQKIVTKVGIWKNFIPDPGPGSRGKKAPIPGSATRLNSLQWRELEENVLHI